MLNELGSHLFHQNTDLDILKLFLPYIKNRFFLDIGAEKGEFTRFFSALGMKGIFFEPLPKCAKELSELAQQTGCIFSSYAIDAQDRTADFYHAFDKENNDAQHFSSLHPLKNDERIQHKKASTVQCRSLNSLLDEGFIPENIGILKIDTEGNDLAVLQGMDNVSAEVLMCEFFMPQIYAGWELGHPNGLIEYARKLGFNHCIAIKRIEGFEIISLDNDIFVNKQWGNLIFISDKIYEQSYAVIQRYIAEREGDFVNESIAKIATLQKACDERLKLIEDMSREINNLRKICDERMNLIDRLSKKLSGIPGSSMLKHSKNWFKNFTLSLLRKN